MRAGLRDVCTGTSVHFLDNQALVLNGVLFLGPTRWTDYPLYEPHHSQSSAMRVAAAGLNDHRQVERDGHAFTPEQALAEHQEARMWLSKELSAPFVAAMRRVA